LITPEDPAPRMGLLVVVSPGGATYSYDLATDTSPSNLVFIGKATDSASSLASKPSASVTETSNYQSRHTAIVPAKYQEHYAASSRFQAPTRTQGSILLRENVHIKWRLASIACGGRFRRLSRTKTLEAKKTLALNARQLAVISGWSTQILNTGPIRQYFSSAYDKILLQYSLQARDDFLYCLNPHCDEGQIHAEKGPKKGDAMGFNKTGSLAEFTSTIGLPSYPCAYHSVSGVGGLLKPQDVNNQKKYTTIHEWRTHDLRLSQDLILGGLGDDTTPCNTSSVTGELGVGHSIDVLALASDVQLIHELECELHSRAGHDASVPVGEVGELALDVEVDGHEVADGVVVVLDEGEIGDGALVSDQPMGLLAQDVVQDAEDALDFILEPATYRRDTLGVIEHEPLAVAEGRSLVGSLVEEPYRREVRYALSSAEAEARKRTSVKIGLLLLVGDKELLLRIVAFGNVLEDGVALPDDLVVVRVVDKGGDTTVGVQLAVLLRLVFLLGEVEDDLPKQTSVRMHGGERG
ncbi:9967_t:CDS:2, partial [Acaulospora colombiana]